MRYTVVVENNIETWHKEGTTILHRENGPAYIRYYKNNNIKEKHYYLNNQLSNKNGPAIIQYYKSGKVRAEKYFLNNQINNENGPAIISYYESGSVAIKGYWLNGKELSKEEWEKQVKQLKQTCDGKVVEIEGKKYKLIEV